MRTLLLTLFLGYTITAYVVGNCTTIVTSRGLCRVCCQEQTLGGTVCTVTGGGC